MKTLRSFRFSALACLAAICFTAVADAQPPGGGQGGRPQQRGGQQRGGQQRGGFQGGGFPGGGGARPLMSRSQLLRSEEVQAEIEVDDAQGATITAALEAYNAEREAARGEMPNFREMEEEERTKAFEKLRADAEELNKKTDEMLNALLEPDQITRLDEIALQANIAASLATVLKSDDIKKKLGIKEEQIAKLEDAEKASQEAMTKMMEEMRASFGGRGRGRGEEGGADAEPAAERPDPRKMMEDARKKSTEAMMAVLTDQQKATLTKLQGKEFDLASLRSGGRGGFGGDRGGQGGRGGAGGRGRGDDGGGQRRRPATDQAI